MEPKEQKEQLDEQQNEYKDGELQQLERSAGCCCAGEARAYPDADAEGEHTEHGGCCGTRHKKRTPEEQKALRTRLRRIEGQIRGIEKMVDNDAYCPDILVQVSAATSALNSFNKVLLGCHIRSCVTEDIRAGKDEAIDEFCELLQKLMR